MPSYPYKCLECGAIQDEFMAMNDVQDQMPLVCKVCEVMTPHIRTYEGYLPGTGYVWGAGQSPPRISGV